VDAFVDAYISRNLCSKMPIWIGTWGFDAYKRLMHISSDAYIRRPLYKHIICYYFISRFLQTWVVSTN